MTDTATMQQPTPMLDRNDVLRAAASWDVVHRPEGRGTFPSRLLAARASLQQLERDLALLPNAVSTPSVTNTALADLRANARLLRSGANAFSGQQSEIARLPRVVLPAQRDEPRGVAAAVLYMRSCGGEFSAPGFRDFIEQVQSQDAFALDELWRMPAFLNFVLLESLLDEASMLLRTSDAISESPVSAGLKSMRAISHTDWASLLEPLITFDPILRNDPTQTYAAMEFDSREQYRRRVVSMARYSDSSESQVAQAAVDLAREARERNASDERIHLRSSHIGYYLLDKGRAQLASRCGYHPPFIETARAFIREHSDDFYISGIQAITIVFIVGLILVPLGRFSLYHSLIAALMLLLPVMQCAVDLINNSVTALFDPDPLPKLDFSNGIPAEYATLVAVPTLLLNEKQVRGLVNDLEVRYLANRDSHLHFALLTDLPDAVSKPRTNDSDPLAELAARLIDELNARYGAANKGGFVLLHRHRVYSVREGVWMGWERKRGKLIDLNKLLAGEFDAFPIKAGRTDLLHQVRYVLTLDSDTQLPRGSAARMVGTIAHPLHQAIIHPTLRIVVAGYGILQPRVGVSVRSASRSRMAAIYSGQSGFDIYTRAISDAYQDLYGEGIFTGKGIYEVSTFHAVLNRRFPRNSLLSHDLIEGAYARAGLATDVELIDDYPSHLSAYNRRKHRWVRGDWQIAQWMFPRVPDESGHLVKNPISDVSRWKIFDNLRRSLVEPFTFVLFIAGWFGLPGGPLFWTIVPLGLMFFPTLVQLAFSLSRALFGTAKGEIPGAISGFAKALFVVVLNLVYLPHQAMLSLDAIVRALVRRFITGERLLEWETAAESEARTRRNTPADRYLVLSPIVALVIAGLLYLLSPQRGHYALIVAAPVLFLWAVAPIVTAWLDAHPRDEHNRLDASGEAFLLGHALRIWRYFHQFGQERHNYLIPDNVEENALFEAARVSPTNVGLLLNARQAACQLGFITIPEFASMTGHTLNTIERLEKHRGHLFNWYDTQTLKPLDASPFVSSVDSGNLVASFYTLHSGALSLLQKPLLDAQLFSGLRAHWYMLRTQTGADAPIAHLALPNASASPTAWIAWICSAAATHAPVDSPSQPATDTWWIDEAQARIGAILALIQGFMPWLLPEYAPLRELPELLFANDPHALTVGDAADFAEQLDLSLRRAWLKLIGNSQLLALGERLCGALAPAKENLRALHASLRSIAETSERMAHETEFGFLVDPGRRILSIGFDVRAGKLHDACYDMVASEARIATFIAIAHDELPQQSWFKLSREHARAFGTFLLLSWTGTMFEYLMPALWMRSYPDTLLSRSLVACVQIQRAFARRQNIPWGISESGAAKVDDAGHYHYQAYGIPQVALSAEATAGPVVAPYATFLALGVDSLDALHNLRHMESSGWVGAFGFYESADFTAPGKAVLVKEWMAHHQGMSLLAILNLLHKDLVQQWFHANPIVQANELLLHELPVSNAVLRARMKE